MADLIGRTLGHCRVVEQIGSGGMATVYKAYQPGLDRYVAIKVLLPVHAELAGFSERFRREARAIANLNHPNILPVYDFGQEGAYGFIVMRYVEGAHTLKEVMQAPLSLSQVVAIITQIAASLDHAHDRGVIHRDIKPSNVLMDGDWVLLTDFGLAKMTEASLQLTGSGVGVGTPAYMSPEQGQGIAVDRRTDIYSLGIILFEMLTGQIPHNAETPFAIVLKRVTEPLPLPRAINPDIPEAVERVILKTLSREPDDRYATAGEMAVALRCAVEASESGWVGLEDAPTLPAVGADDEGVGRWEQVLPETPAEVPSALESLPAQAPLAQAPAATPPPARALSGRAFPWKWAAGIGVIAAVLVLLVIGFGSEWWSRKLTPTVPSAGLTPTSASDVPAPTNDPSLLTVKVRVRVVSNSDSTSVDLGFDGEISERRMIEVDGDVTTAEMSFNTISLDQDIDRAEEGHTVSLVQDVTLSGVPAKKRIWFTIRKGCIGQSTVEVYNVVADPPVLVERVVLPECNPEVFLLYPEVLLTENPSPSPTPLATPIPTPDVLAPTPTVDPSLLTVQVRVRLVSGSDWTSVNLGFYGEVSEHSMVEVDGDVTVAEMAFNTISLDQDIDRAEEGHTVSLVQDVTLSGVPEEKRIWFKVSKGCIGQVTVEVFNVVVDPPVLVERVVLPECNPEVFMLYPEVLLTEDPPPSPTPLPTPHPGEALFEQGLSLLDERAFGPALDRFDEALAAGLDTAELHYWRGWACNEAYYYDGLCGYERAVADYGRAIERDPGNDRYYGDRAWTYTLLEQVDLAIADYTTAIELAPEVAAYWRERGFRYFDRQDYEAAREGFDRALELDPEECSALVGRGHYWDVQGEYATAVDEYSKVLEICPDFWNTYIERAWIYFEHLDRADLALDDLDRAVELDPKDPHPRFQRALVHDRLDQVDEAREDYAAFLGLTEGDASYAEWRAQAERWFAEHPE